MKLLLFILKLPFLLLAWALHGLSEWFYDAASWIYERCGTNIFEASIEWSKE